MRSLVSWTLLAWSMGCAHAAEVTLVDRATVPAVQPNNGNTFIPASDDAGTKWVFSSTATSLSLQDRTRIEDVYWYDHASNQTLLVSKNAAGGSGNSYSSGAAISGDGQVVVFYSAATNLVPGDTNGVEDIFIWTRANGALERVRAPGGAQLGGHSYWPRITPDGRYVTFTSQATNILLGEDATADVFRLDRDTGTIVRVSQRADGIKGNGESARSDISADGNVVVFMSSASNLVASDTNTARDVYRKDLSTGALTLVSRNLSGVSAGVAVDSLTWGNRISADGTRVAFISKAALTNGSNTLGQAYVYSSPDDSVTLVSSGVSGASNGPCFDARISADGLRAMFTCAGTNLVANDTNGVRDVFLREVAGGTVTRQSVGASGEQLSAESYAPIFAGNGVLGFLTLAPELAPRAPQVGYQLFSRGLLTKAAGLVNISESAAGEVIETFPDDGAFERSYHGPSMTSNNQLVAYSSLANNIVAGDANPGGDVFVANVASGVTTRETAVAGDASAGDVENAVLSDDGRYLLVSATRDLSGGGSPDSHVYRKDRTSGAWSGVTTPADGGRFAQPHASANGKVMALAGRSTVGVADQIFVRRDESGLGALEPVSVASDLAPGNGDSSLPFVSADGSTVAFNSTATNFASVNPNSATDVFVRDLTLGTTELISVGPTGAVSDQARHGGVSFNGRYVLFWSDTWLLAPPAPAAAGGYLYRKDRSDGSLQWVSRTASGANALPGTMGQAEISRDGKQALVLYTGIITGTGTTHSAPKTVLIDIDSAFVRSVARTPSGTLDDGEQSFAHFSPDGKRVLLLSTGETLSSEDGNLSFRSVFLTSEWDTIFGGSRRGAGFED